MLDVLMAAHWIESDAGTDGSLVLVVAAALVVVAATLVVDRCVVGASVANVVGATVGVEVATVATGGSTTPRKVVAMVEGVIVVVLVLATSTGAVSFCINDSVDAVWRLVPVWLVVDVVVVGGIEVVTMVVSWLAGTTSTRPLCMAGNAAATEAAASDATATATAIPARRPR
jgi:hypothetical protein